MSLWTLVIVTSAGCYALKLIGYLIPARYLDHPRSRHLVELLPVALLAALVVVETVGRGSQLHLDVPRLVGIATGSLAVLLRAPFLLVLVAAALGAVLVRHL